MSYTILLAYSPFTLHPQLPTFILPIARLVFFFIYIFYPDFLYRLVVGTREGVAMVWDFELTGFNQIFFLVYFPDLFLVFIYI